MRGTGMLWCGVRRVTAVLAVVLAMSAFTAVGPAAAQDEESVEFDLNELNDSGVTGTAVLTAEGDETNITLELTGDAIVGGHPANIYEGTCDDLDPNPAFELTDVDEDGLSETTVDVSLEDLTGDTPYAINVLLSSEELGVYIACGDISNVSGGAVAVGGGDDEAATTATASAVGGGDNEVATTTTTPASGVGTAFSADGSGVLVAGFAALAGMLAAGGLALRAREGRR
ncbi:MAG: hypothetical protein M3Q03_00770 [Chloroflexota bacterium]|nr:hypothetical protein [Chloroflexota bacterium]